MNIPPPNYDECTQEHINVVYPQIHPQQPPTIPQTFILGPNSQQAYCPSCKKQVLTNVKYVNGIQTWLSFILFIIICVFISWIPFCINIGKDSEHHCIQCNAYIGTYKRLRKIKSCQ
ncbi:LITAF domain-containing protein [Meloidogyne graminicola]|uniref:LITAF domain-containing protein n=1 Tax=Meloidogyne graminicola TaxID=189291 RepID=A0A8S9ZNX2_9BILA|nr:LITAF domain-containing protein [Meloidogyne graminicola]